MPLSLGCQFQSSLGAVLSAHRHFLMSFDKSVRPYTILHTLGWSNLLAEEERKEV